MAGLGRHWQPKLFPPKAIFALMLDDWLTLPPTSPTGSEQKAEEKWLLSIHSTYRLGKKKTLDIYLLKQKQQDLASILSSV